MSRYRQHYESYIMDLIRKIGVCDRMYIETGELDWLETYEMLKTEVEELKKDVKYMEQNYEAYNNQDIEKEPPK